MNHLKALGIKYIFTMIVIFSIFGIFYNASLGRLFWISVLVTGVAYLIGDLFLLPRFGNLVASIADFGLAFIAFWVLGNLLIQVSIQIIPVSLFAAFFITCCEPLFHTYMEERVLHKRREVRPSHRLQTEVAEENDVYTITDKNKKTDTDN
ncbi:YndM family protein [Virgibacillus byunsanensis]|uniref:YndM family protein n=1 Tax=Virgibacillus byunsanensis TaxID=570945 RepID=A0ABW3LMY5_9BACI